MTGTDIFPKQLAQNIARFFVSTSTDERVAETQIISLTPINDRTQFIGAAQYQYAFAVMAIIIHKAYTHAENPESMARGWQTLSKPMISVTEENIIDDVLRRHGFWQTALIELTAMAMASPIFAHKIFAPAALAAPEVYKLIMSTGRRWQPASTFRAFVVHGAEKALRRKIETPEQLAVALAFAE